MYIWWKRQAAGRVESNFCRQSRVGSGQRFAGSGRVGFKKNDPWTTLGIMAERCLRSTIIFFISVTTADYFIVGVTNTSWSMSRPVRGRYPLCGQYQKALTAGSTVTQWCNVDTPPSQYVIIQQPAQGPGYLIICELQVYGCEL